MRDGLRSDVLAERFAVSLLARTVTTWLILIRRLQPVRPRSSRGLVDGSASLLAAGTAKKLGNSETSEWELPVFQHVYTGVGYRLRWWDDAALEDLHTMEVGAFLSPGLG